MGTKVERWKLLEDLRQFHKSNTLRAFLVFVPTAGEVLSLKKGQGHSDFSQKDPFKHQFLALKSSHSRAPMERKEKKEESDEQLKKKSK